MESRFSGTYAGAVWHYELSWCPRCDGTDWKTINLFGPATMDPYIAITYLPDLVADGEPVLAHALHIQPTAWIGYPSFTFAAWGCNMYAWGDMLQDTFNVPCSLESLSWEHCPFNSTRHVLENMFNDEYEGLGVTQVVHTRDCCVDPACLEYRDFDCPEEISGGFPQWLSQAPPMVYDEGSFENGHESEIMNPAVVLASSCKGGSGKALTAQWEWEQCEVQIALPGLCLDEYSPKKKLCKRVADEGLHVCPEHSPECNDEYSIGVLNNYVWNFYYQDDDWLNADWHGVVSHEGAQAFGAMPELPPPDLVKV
jgi:hypothetical protein